MISVIEAEKLISDSVHEWGLCTKPIENVESEVLRETIFADLNSPPFDRVTMDGYAISFSGLNTPNQLFSIQAQQKAGEPQIRLKDKNSCIGVSTGGIVPNGCDCIIKKEDITKHDNTIEILQYNTIKSKQNIHKKGADYLEGSELIKPNTIISPTQIGVLASTGKHTIKVSKKPRIAIISTGNELVPIEQSPKEYQIRLSNAQVIHSALENFGFTDVDKFHLLDDYSLIEESIKKYLDCYDVLISSGGVSAGNFDFMPKALKQNGVIETFHKIKQRPGKPMWFGQKNNQLIFGLPGNPVSALTSLYRYVIPSLRKGLGINTAHTDFIKLTETIESNSKFTIFKQVKTIQKEGLTWGTPIQNNGSGDFYSLTKSDGFIECLENTGPFPEGSLMRYYKWKH